STLIAALNDEDARVRKTAVWICDEYMDNYPEILSELEKLKDDPSGDVRYQLALTLRFKEIDKAQDIINYLLKTYPDHVVLVESVKKYKTVLAAKEESERKARELKQSERELVERGATIFNSLCGTCHGSDGKG